MKSFPIPVVVSGSATPSEDEVLDYISMPKNMDTYRPPILPEIAEIAVRTKARTALGSVLALLDAAAKGRPGGQVSLRDLPNDDRHLINHLMGEGEASVIVDDSELQIRIQESVFAGVWRIMTFNGDALVNDVIEVGPIPSLLQTVAEEDAKEPYRPWEGPLPPNVQNAPMLVEEIRDQVLHWRPGQTSHVINLTLLPVTPDDIGYLDHQLGTGRVLLLSRGYGNCRISNTRLRHCWRVVYYNSMDKVILNTVEVVDIPEVATAAPEDLRDSHERLQDVLGYIEQALLQ